VVALVKFKLTHFTSKWTFFATETLQGKTIRQFTDIGTLTNLLGFRLLSSLLVFLVCRSMVRVMSTNMLEDLFLVCATVIALLATPKQALVRRRSRR
jgi:hypothetical protein